MSAENSPAPGSHIDPESGICSMLALAIQIGMDVGDNSLGVDHGSGCGVLAARYGIDTQAECPVIHMLNDRGNS